MKVLLPGDAIEESQRPWCSAPAPANPEVHTSRSLRRDFAGKGLPSMTLAAQWRGRSADKLARCSPANNGQFGLLEVDQRELIDSCSSNRRVEVLTSLSLSLSPSFLHTTRVAMTYPGAPAPPRCIITSHDADGRAIVGVDAPVKMTAPPGGFKAAMGVAWLSPEFPHSNEKEGDLLAFPEERGNAPESEWYAFAARRSRCCRSTRPLCAEI